MDQSIDNLSGLSNSAKNMYGEIFRETQPDNFDYQEWIDQCDDPETKLRRSADLLELKQAGLVQFEIELFNIRLSQRRPLAQAMETDHYSDKSTNESHSKRAKIEVECPSTSPKAAVNDDDSCPLTMLPPDILAMILINRKRINHIPIVEWPKLELMPPFQPAILEAWRQVRCVSVKRDFSIQPEVYGDPSSRDKIVSRIKSILQKLVLRSPFLATLNGIDIPRAEGNSLDIVSSIAQFDHLQSITVGDAYLFNGTREYLRQYGTLEDIIEFLETTQSRTSLKEVHMLHVSPRQSDNAMIMDRFSASFTNGRDIRSPLKLEKLTFLPKDCPHFVRLDNIDARRLTDIRLGKAYVEPEQWIGLIERAPKLREIHLSLLNCAGACTQQRLQANKKLLTALESRERLTAISFDCSSFNGNCRCLHMEWEFIRMLKTIGGRGLLRKFSMQPLVRVSPGNIDSDRVCPSICEYIPYLRSLKLRPANVDAVSNIIRMRELEDVHFGSGMTPNGLREIAKLPHLKRLALCGLGFRDLHREDTTSALESLVNATTLVDLRIDNATRVTPDVVRKWTDTIAPNLQVLMLIEFAWEYSDMGDALAKLLEKTVRLHTLVLNGDIVERILSAIAESCPNLEILAITNEGYNNEEPSMGEDEPFTITVQHVQHIVDNCPKLRRLGAIGHEIWKQLQIPTDRKIIYDVDSEFWEHDLDGNEYD